MVEVIVIKKNGVGIRVPATSISTTQERNGSSGSLHVSYIDKNINAEFGDAVCLVYNNTNIFYGYVFSVSFKDTMTYMTAYDQMRYLIFKDSLFLENMSASDLVLNIASQRSLSLVECDNTGFILNPKIFNEVTYLDMISKCISQTKDYTGKSFVLFDRAGNLHFKNCDNLFLDFSISHNSNIISYEYCHDINKDTFSFFKIIRENKKTGLKDTFIKQNALSQEKWGTLQYYKKVNEKTTDGEINTNLNFLYNSKSAPKSTLKITCLGNVLLHVGHVVAVIIDEIHLNERFVIDKIVHKFQKSEHICDIVLSKY